MQIKEKLPVGVNGISKMMKMLPEEIRAWPYFDDVRNNFRDFNFGILNKVKLLENLLYISNECAKDEIYHYSQGIDNLLIVIKACY